MAKENKGRVSKKEIMKTAPEEIGEFWFDAEVREAFKSLNENQQDFFIEYLSNGKNASQAYRDTYNKSANDNVASVCGHRTLSNANICLILEKIEEPKILKLQRINKVYNDGLEAFKPVFSKEGEKVMEIEDHAIRIKAADSLAKSNNMIVDHKKIEGEMTHNHNVTSDFMKDMQERTGRPIETASHEVIEGKREIVARETPEEEKTPEFEVFGWLNSCLDSQPFLICPLLSGFLLVLSFHFPFLYPVKNYPDHPVRVACLGFVVRVLPLFSSLQASASGPLLFQWNISHHLELFPISLFLTSPRCKLGIPLLDTFLRCQPNPSKGQYYATQSCPPFHRLYWCIALLWLC